MSEFTQSSFFKPVRWLVRPSPKLSTTNQERAEHFLILYGLYIVIALVYSAIAITSLAIAGDAASVRSSIQGTAYALPINLLVFFLARSRWFLLAVGLALVIFDLMLLLSFVAGTARPELAILMVIPIMMSAFLFGLWVTIGVGIVQLSILLWQILMAIESPAGVAAAAELPIVLLLGAVSIAAAWVGRRRQRRGRATLELANRELSVVKQSLEKRIAAQTETLRASNRELEDRRRHLQTLYDQAADAFFVVDMNGVILEVNQWACDSLGYTSDELVGMTRDKVEAEFDINGTPNGELRPGQLFVGRARYRRKDGSLFPVEIRATLLELEGERRVFAVARDVTEQQRAARRLRTLTQELVVAQERERARVAAALHDETGQSLTALRYGLTMALDTASAETPNLATVQTQLRSALELLSKASEEIRRMAHTLRPAALEDLGLADAISGICHDYARTTPLVINYRCSDLPEIPPLTGITAYRIVQEGLTNVVRHASATVVDVDVTHDDHDLTVVIKDDGSGFDPLAQMESDDGGMGLAAMRERARLIDGSLTIESAEHGGSRLTAVVPYAQ